MPLFVHKTLCFTQGILTSMTAALLGRNFLRVVCVLREGIEGLGDAMVLNGINLVC